MVALFYLEKRENMDSREEIIGAYRTSSGKSIDQLERRVSFLERDQKEKCETINLYKQWPEKKKRVIVGLKIAFGLSGILGAIILTVGGLWFEQSAAEEKTAELATVEHERVMEVADKKLQRQQHEAKQAEKSNAAEKKRKARLAEINAKTKAFNQVFRDNVFKSLDKWKSDNKIAGVSGCSGLRGVAKVDVHSFFQCDVMRDFKPDIKILCTDKVCGGAKAKE